MNKAVKWLLGGAAVVAIWYYIKTVSNVAGLSVVVSSFKIHSLSLKELVFRFNLDVINPAKASVTINRINGNIKHNGQIIGTFDYSKPIVCEGWNATTNIKDISVSVSSLATVVQLYNWYTAGSTKADFVISGRLISNGNEYPFETKKTLQ